MRDEPIELITVLGIEKDQSGFKTNEKRKVVEVFANVKSVARTEYYEALRSGIKAAYIFEIDPDDFEMGTEIITVEGREKKVKASIILYDGTEYRICRTFRNNRGMFEVTCEEVE